MDVHNLLYFSFYIYSIHEIQAKVKFWFVLDFLGSFLDFLEICFQGREFGVGAFCAVCITYRGSAGAFLCISSKMLKC
jgi:hypothetical protein